MTTTDDTPIARPSRRGGRRPGAGAPKGNLNAVRTANYTQSADAYFYALPPAARGAFFVAIAWAGYNENVDAGESLTSLEAARRGFLRARHCLRNVDWSVPRTPAEVQQAATEALAPIFNTRRDLFERAMRNLAPRYARKQSDNRDPLPEAAPPDPTMRQSTAEQLSRLER